MISLEIISVTRDIVFIFAAIATARVARDGLGSWNRELKGKADFEVARSLIRSVYRLRDKLRSCRSIIYILDEFPEGYDTGNETSEQKAKAHSFICSNRWKLVAEELQCFESQALEGEALWGSNFKLKANELRLCAIDLRVALEADVSNVNNSGEDFKCDPDFGRLIKSKIWLTVDESDPLTLKINNAISDIEKEIRPHFKRS